MQGDWDSGQGPEKGVAMRFDPAAAIHLHNLFIDIDFSVGFRRGLADISFSIFLWCKSELLCMFRSVAEFIGKSHCGRVPPQSCSKENDVSSNSFDAYDHPTPVQI